MKKERIGEVEIHRQINELFNLADSNFALSDNRMHTYKLARPPPKVNRNQSWLIVCWYSSDSSGPSICLHLAGPWYGTAGGRGPTDAERSPVLWIGIKMVWIFFECIRDRIHLEGFRSIRIRVRMFNIRYHNCIWILKSYIYNVDIQSYLIRYCWPYTYSNPNPTKNMKTNMISVISVRIWSVFIPSYECTSSDEDAE
jgi:hypothetical protein